MSACSCDNASGFAAIYLAFAITGLWLGGNPEAVNALITLINSYIPDLISDDSAFATPEQVQAIASQNSGVLGWTGIIALGVLIWTAIDWVTYTRRAVRELFAIHDFRGDYAALGKLLTPALTEAEARGAVELLVRLKLVRKNAQGGYEPTDRVLLSGPKASPETVRPVLLGNLELARRALDAFPAAARPFSGATLSVSEQSLRRIHERFLAFRREAFELAMQDEEVDRLYQMNFQLFPLSGTVTRRKK